MTVSVSVSVDNVACFRYSDGGTNLLLGYVNNVVANGRKNLAEGTYVLNVSKDLNGNYQAVVGIATGEVVNESPTVFWPNWNKDSVIFSVKWLTKPATIAESYAWQNNSLSLVKTAAAINHLLLQELVGN